MKESRAGRAGLFVGGAAVGIGSLALCGLISQCTAPEAAPTPVPIATPGFTDRPQQGITYITPEAFLTPVVEPSVEYYDVVEGDTLWSIAARHGIDVASLARLNGIDNPDLILAGSRLHINANSEVQFGQVLSHDISEEQCYPIPTGGSVYGTMVDNGISFDENEVIVRFPTQPNKQPKTFVSRELSKNNAFVLVNAGDQVCEMTDN